MDYFGKLTIHSSVEDVEDFIIFHKYISSDENYGVEIENFLVESERFIDSLSKDDKVPSELITKLINLVGDGYNVRYL